MSVWQGKSFYSSYYRAIKTGTEKLYSDRRCRRTGTIREDGVWASLLGKPRQRLTKSQ